MFLYIPLLSLLLTISFFPLFTTANFDLYVVRGEIDTAFPWPDTIGGWIVEDHDPPSCTDIDPEDATENSGWKERDDLSHGRLGVRCWPKEHCGVDHINEDPWPQVQGVEMHFTNNPLWHFTIYKDRGYVDGTTLKWPMYGTDGKKYGDCFVYSGQSFGTCSWHDGHRRLWGQRKFRCLATVTAEELKKERRKQPDREGERGLEVRGRKNGTERAVVWEG